MHWPLGPWLHSCAPVAQTGWATYQITNRAGTRQYECEEHACMTNWRSHQTVCVCRKHISSSLPFSSPSPQPAARLGLIVQQQSVCVPQRRGAIGKTIHRRSREEKIHLCSFQRRSIFRSEAKKLQENNLVLLIFCACVTFPLLCCSIKYTALLCSAVITFH